MAFIQLVAEPDNPDNHFLLSAEHILSVSLAPYSGSSGAYTHFLTISIQGQLPFAANFTSLSAAQTAYNNLSAYLAPATTINLY